MREGRGPDELRSLRIERGYTEMTPGSVLIEMGRTWVLCTATFESSVPPWLRGQGRGWVTAEYAMLPGSSRERVSREAYKGGRSKEIQRLVGRVLRAVVDLEAMGELLVRVDCDVLQADGGTRTAAVTGAWVAMHDAFRQAREDGVLEGDPVRDQCAAVSVGLVEGEVLLDLDYREDVSAEVDMNVAMTGAGGLIEVQGTAEGRSFSRDQLTLMVDLAQKGISELVARQRRAVEEG